LNDRLEGSLCCGFCFIRDQGLRVTLLKREELLESHQTVLLMLGVTLFMKKPGVGLESLDCGSLPNVESQTGAEEINEFRGKLTQVIGQGNLTMSIKDLVFLVTVKETTALHRLPLRLSRGRDRSLSGELMFAGEVDVH
jgi:hypothetical protein